MRTSVTSSADLIVFFLCAQVRGRCRQLVAPVDNGGAIDGVIASDLGDGLAGEEGGEDRGTLLVIVGLAHRSRVSLARDDTRIGRVLVLSRFGSGALPVSWHSIQKPSRGSASFGQSGILHGSRSWFTHRTGTVWPCRSRDGRW